MGLRDPDKPAGAIVEVFEDGDALRNDGVRLTAARKNPWYVLATVAGEHKGYYNGELHDRNKRFWNGWMCQNMEHHSRDSIARKVNVKQHELLRLSAKETNTLNNRFKLSFPDQDHNVLLNSIGDIAHFQDLFFKGDFFLDGFFMPQQTIFSGSYFSRHFCLVSTHFIGDASFDSIHVSGDLQIQNAEFLGTSYFNLANFERGAIFNGVHFHRSVSFRHSKFQGPTFFDNVHFGRHADFDSACFLRRSVFKSAIFSSIASFSDGEFKGKTNFSETHFKASVPTFYQREMHQDTTFTEDPAYWPTPTPDNAQEGKQAYTRLRQIAAGNQNPDLEHFFLRQEMRCKEVLATGIDRMAFAAYRIFADYGISVARPLCALGVVYSLGVGIIGSYLRYGNHSPTPIGDGAMIALGNTLPFINISEKMHQDFYKHAPWWLDLLSALQSILGIILIFFAALGLRNRFRLK